MNRVGIAVLALLIAVFATPAAAIPDEDWAIFLEWSSSQFGVDEEQDWEDHLFEAAGAETDRSRAVARFGRAAGLKPEQAGAYAEVIVASVVLRERCQETCTFSPDAPEWRRVISPALAEPSGELLWVIGRNLTGARGPVRTDAFLRLVEDHPARVRVMTRLYEYSEDLALLAGLLLERPLDPALLKALTVSNPTVNGGPDAWDGWQLAVLEVAAARAQAREGGPAEQAVYAQTVLIRYFQLGMTDGGLRLFHTLPGAVRDLLPLTAPPCVSDGDDACAARPGSEVLTDELIAALALEGDRVAAAEIAERAAAHLGDAAQWDSRERHLAVLDALEPSVPVADLFGLMVEGDGLNPEGHHSGISGSGRMFLDYGPAARRLVAARVREAGYPGIARNLEQRPLYYRTDIEGYEDLLSRIRFPDEVAVRRAELAAAIEAAWVATGDTPAHPRNATPSPPAGWREAKLPEGVAAWTRPAEPVAGNDEPLSMPTELAGLPVAAGAVLRHEAIDGERYVLFQSAEFDLPGEIPAYGIWLARTEDGVWTDPAYLGLQQHFPYVVSASSALPLVEDGRLQIEVQVREIASRSITFPPVGLSLALQEDGLVISRPLEEVFADSDSDGLTDIAELRLRMDPRLPDTDSDGQPDGLDPAPLTATDGPASPARRTLALAILQQMTGHDSGAIVLSPRAPTDEPMELDDMLADMGEPPPPPPAPRSIILVSDDPGLFTGLDLPFRLLVFTTEQVRRLSESGRPFYPPQVDVYSSLDGRQHYVVWSASWVGGAFIARCPADGGPCEVEEKSSWIT